MELVDFNSRIVYLEVRLNSAEKRIADLQNSSALLFMLGLGTLLLFGFYEVVVRKSQGRALS